MEAMRLMCLPSSMTCSEKTTEILTVKQRRSCSPNTTISINAHRLRSRDSVMRRPLTINPPSIMNLLKKITTFPAFQPNWTGRHCNAAFLWVVFAIFAMPSDGISAVTIPAPLLDYSFNATTNNAGSLSNADLTISGGGGNAKIGADKSGVSGLAGDYAFVTANTSHGSNGGTGVAQSTTADLPELSSFTITGWFKTSTAINNGGYLFASGSIILRTNSVDISTGCLNLSVEGKNSGRTNLTAPNLYAKTNEWVFFAVTFNGAQASFYQGDTVTGVSTRSNLTLANGSFNPAAGLLIGNNGKTVFSDVRAFAGSLDNIRFFGSALSIEQLEKIRTADTLNQSLASLNIPEPASVTFLFGTIAILTLAGLKRWKA
ncbi:LamG domain-containing protein [Opitutaceae bacterium TAV4]|nr:LamG domain-containing protein [Opitutaceae bacterium TAV4]RRK00526.1 LamG domain-containing protein [Opitutaceae bacterium TAV3]